MTISPSWILTCHSTTVLVNQPLSYYRGAKDSIIQCPITNLNDSIICIDGDGILASKCQHFWSATPQHHLTDCYILESDLTDLCIIVVPQLSNQMVAMPLVNSLQQQHTSSMGQNELAKRCNKILPFTIQFKTRHGNITLTTNHEIVVLVSCINQPQQSLGVQDILFQRNLS